MEMEVGMDMDFFFFRGPTGSDVTMFSLTQKTRHDGLDGCSSPLRDYTRRIPQYTHSTYTIHDNGGGGGGVGCRASECVIRAVCQLER